MSGASPRAVDEGKTLQRAALGDRWYRIALTIAVATVPALLLVMVWKLWDGARAAIERFGLGFILGSGWDPVRDQYGAAELLAGTLFTTILATLLAAPLAVAGALWYERFAPLSLRRPIGALIDLLAAVPGVVYGLWGVVVMLPWCRTTLFPTLQRQGEWLPGVDGIVYGPSLLAAALLLAVMMFPFILVTAREVLRTIPEDRITAALALGATRWEAVQTVLLPSARHGLLGVAVLGAGRALGEAIAVSMVIGAGHGPITSLLGPGYTLASVLPHEFAEASSAMQVAALSYATLILLIVAVITNAGARILLDRGVGSTIR